ncbi:MAG: Hsp20/alpha crystallin family protein [Pseudomonadales bacterium]|nr:Hsp20/alpha crystallin family protein [Pseudomonadales bacterium]MBO6566582.1 Hsp20/alpha crystallin family protein [Pseudomonadales bacterium]MBO6597659.1 Hsp20/alpha crystallin family protein [Pseudomonadales bacterium]MBO6658016.1 Hsp20/alpha crystallin family protein [Pseudomonadales bacterium]MBO6703974.1 Hsp20/alpha crystallin family protein [Pseudomonadales bacterium]
MSYLVSPFRPLNHIHRDLNRFFDGDRLSPLAEGANWSPQVDIVENDEAFVITADMPGVSAEEIEISLHHGVLTIKGERSTERETTESAFTRRERVQGTFYRQFNLPETADEDTVSARYDDGVLGITIPKASKAKPKIVSVN